MSGPPSRLSLRSRPARAQGFSLVELLLVLAIIAIISGIAIPAFMGQRKRAKVIGDAQANVRVLAMMLEGRKAEVGLYGTAGTIQSWTASGAIPSASTSLAPGFAPKGSSRMDYQVGVTGVGVAYTITVTDPGRSGMTVLTADQSGALTLNTSY